MMTQLILYIHEVHTHTHTILLFMEEEHTYTVVPSIASFDAYSIFFYGNYPIMNLRAACACTGLSLTVEELVDVQYSAPLRWGGGGASIKSIMLWKESHSAFAEARKPGGCDTLDVSRVCFSHTWYLDDGQFSHKAIVTYRNCRDVDVDGKALTTRRMANEAASKVYARTAGKQQKIYAPLVAKGAEKATAELGMPLEEKDISRRESMGDGHDDLGFLERVIIKTFPIVHSQDHTVAHIMQMLEVARTAIVGGQEALRSLQEGSGGQWLVTGIGSLRMNLGTTSITDTIFEVKATPVVSEALRGQLASQVDNVKVPIYQAVVSLPSGDIVAEGIVDMIRIRM